MLLNRYQFDGPIDRFIDRSDRYQLQSPYKPPLGVCAIYSETTLDRHFRKTSPPWGPGALGPREHVMRPLFLAREFARFGKSGQLTLVP